MMLALPTRAGANAEGTCQRLLRDADDRRVLFTYYNPDVWAKRF